MSNYVIGLDIGGTKCACLLGKYHNKELQIIDKKRWVTPSTPQEAIARFMTHCDAFIAEHPVKAIGTSCGGPLDAEKGIILSPPNLPGWDKIKIVQQFATHYGLPVRLENDANACALAEHRFGAGQDAQHLIFLTFGTGMGAGLILDGRLYRGKSGQAGEIGHLRIRDNGPVGFGKAGSFEGSCSGAGIATLAQKHWEELFPGKSFDAKNAARDLAFLANDGHPLAKSLYQEVGHQLGAGVALLIDAFNPEKIIIGSIYERQTALLEPSMMDRLRAECLPQNLADCKIVPAKLGDAIGDFASLTLATELID
ncbi:ROK family protein [Listeria costaricensis]|uniref:ROK family protein n=1 Tax=Listeria costaricensis TaxID=2026604 RepID=UPI000C07FE1C|nr:ROK family protein [Listeria costaricensis]